MSAFACARARVCVRACVREKDRKAHSHSTNFPCDRKVKTQKKDKESLTSIFFTFIRNHLHLRVHARFHAEKESASRKRSDLMCVQDLSCNLLSFCHGRSRSVYHLNPNSLRDTMLLLLGPAHARHPQDKNHHRHQRCGSRISRIYGSRIIYHHRHQHCGKASKQDSRSPPNTIR